MNTTRRARFLSWIELGAVGSLLLIALAVRLYHLDWPLADWHSFRQADTASVTREYVKNGVDLLRPQYHDLSNIQSGKDNLEGWRMVEFPLVNGVIASMLRAQPQWDLVVVSRLFSIGASLLSLSFLWALARQYYGKLVALVAMAVFALMPYSIFYSRTILPEPFLVLALMITTWSIVQWSARSKKTWKVTLPDAWLVVAGVFWAVALLMKPVAIFYSPLFLGVIWRYRRFALSDLLKLGVVFGVGFGPLLWWRNWIQQFPSGVPAADWLLNGNGIRLRPAWWRWLFGDRLGRLMFGNWGTALLALGAIVGALETPFVRLSRKPLTAVVQLARWKEAWFHQDGLVVGGLLSILSYFVVIASGNVQHDYYQVVTIPIIALVWARGAVWVFRQAKTWVHQLIAFGALSIVSLFSFLFSWYEIEGFYHINNPAIVSGGEAVDRLTPPNALVVAPQFGDTSFLFQTNRRGWPIGFEMDDKIAKGAQFYITTSQDDEANELMKTYTVIEQTKEYILIDLRQKKGK